LRGAADTTLQKEVKETQPLVFQPLTSPFDFLTVENEIIYSIITFKRRQRHKYQKNKEYLRNKKEGLQ